MTIKGLQLHHYRLNTRKSEPKKHCNGNCDKLLSNRRFYLFISARPAEVEIQATLVFKMQVIGSKRFE